MDDTQYLSQEKLDALIKELKDFKEKTITDLAKRIDDARQLGDLSENAEYHAAREEMAWAQSRVKELEFIIQNAKIISDADHAGDRVGLGSTVVVSTHGKERTFAIVGAQEADPTSGKISNESPLGSAFLGKKKGDKVSVKVPLGMQDYTIIKVS